MLRVWIHPMGDQVVQLWWACHGVNDEMLRIYGVVCFSSWFLSLILLVFVAPYWYAAANFAFPEYIYDIGTVVLLLLFIFCFSGWVFLPCDHGLDLWNQLMWEFNNSINQSINQSIGYQSRYVASKFERLHKSSIWYVWHTEHLSR